MKANSDSDRSRSRAILLISAGTIALVLLLHWKSYEPLVEAEFQVQDMVARTGKLTPPDPRLILIGIDKPTYYEDILEREAKSDPVLAAMRENFPWSRIVWATLVEKLLQAGAELVVIDLVFATPSDGDDELREVLEKYRDRIVIGSLHHTAELVGGGTESSMVVPAGSIFRPENGEPIALDDRVGFVNVWPDGDGVVRRARYRATNDQFGNTVEAEPGAKIESLAARTLTKMGEADRVPAALEPIRFRYTGAPGAGYPTHRIGDVVWPSTWEANYQSGEFFRGKVVLIGATAEIFKDNHRTPFIPRQMPGPEVHLNIINAALHGAFLSELSIAGQLLVIASYGAMMTLISLKVRRPWRRLGALVGIGALSVLVAKSMHDYLGNVVPVVSPLLALVAGGSVTLTFDFFLERLKRAQLRHTMGLYFSPKVLDAVLANPGSMEPHRADVTLLLTDLRNSTPLAELLGPVGMFNLLNRVFEVQTAAIMGEDGNLEHFLGDQFLSYWGAPEPQPDGPQQAVRAALKLIEGMEGVRESLPPEVKRLFGYGVALHSGSVLVGNKGSSQRMDYGLVGDTVNEAARVESLTKLYGSQLIVTRETLGQLTRPGDRRLLDRVIVKGKSVPVELFELENPCTSGHYQDLCRRYEMAYHDYAEGRFVAAKEIFERLASEFDDAPSRLLATRCNEFIGHPRADWNGIWRMSSK